MCARTIYCTNIDKKVLLFEQFIICWHLGFFFFFGFLYDCYSALFLQVSQADVKLFFESVCGEVCDFLGNLKYYIFLLFLFLFCFVFGLQQ